MSEEQTTNYTDYDDKMSYNQTHLNSVGNNKHTTSIIIPQAQFVEEQDDQTEYQTTVIRLQPAAATHPPPVAQPFNPTSTTYTTNNSRSAFNSHHPSGSASKTKQSPPSTFWKDQNNLGTQLNRSPQFNQRYNEFNPAPVQKRQSHPQFVHETLNYVFGQLCVSVAIVALMYAHKTQVKNYIINNSTIVWIPIITTFATMISLFCCVSKGSTVTRQTLFWLFTISCGAMVGISTIEYAPHVVLNATVTLLVVVGFINIWSYKMAQNGTDISYLGPSLLSALLMIITISVLNIFIKSTFVENCITVVSVILFTMLLLYDLNRLYSGAEEEEYADPLIAAINIYLDIINLFLNLLRLFGNDGD